MTIEGRDVRGREDLEAGAAGVGRELGRLVPASIPPGLRLRVLSRAEFARRSVMLSPAMRVAAAACLLLIAAALLIDPLVGRHEAARLAALLDGRSSPRVASEETAELAEVLGMKGRETERMTRLQLAAAAAARKEQENQITEAWKRLKGWLGYEASEEPE